MLTEFIDCFTISYGITLLSVTDVTLKSGKIEGVEKKI